ncbi:MAG: (Dimethylallyl)adenosine tRNA methylthiotransferase MiaB [bacterium ADurb.Bin212]|nr:MAG: (Dimethylallyl)adenosine tRNA methylthiotransferase MiaB [bacterium ADurb.Bin212]
MKYYLWTIGCQYNEWDSARLGYLLQKLGLIESKQEDADIIIVLACSVRQTAIDRIFGKIKSWPDKKVLISGCVLEKDRAKFAAKNIEIFESGDIKHLFEILSEHFDNRFEHFKLSEFYSLLSEQNTQSMYIPITIGCNNFCSYCAVPYTRGREKSRAMDEVVNDAKTLIKKGQKEIMLLGQNVNSYNAGRNESGIINGGKTKSDFALLLEKLNDLPGDFKISFTSNHPKDMTDDIIEAVARLPKVIKQIHLPLQSGSDKILKAMNRPYTKKQYLDIVNKIKTAEVPIKITTDVIVGFPGETEKDFQETVEVFKKVGYSIAYVNKYSPRAGTAAHKLGDPIAWSEKKRRWKILDEIANKK